ncbi:oxidative damage protection protein [Candidatus Pantoea edessiphila]|uniref:Probable Fe(2+)-trafficking protein n=1 Tax=Candidatus Pantoea edessiphila TaxID=2044610 RepID=A0A2P5SZU7_9GAMM|nr:oxidative damage protection protein [Candidatus Pantoea edessiphila]PPI87836.1 oxidative damage protection protein [Candidatus Pantoea edessiphila]
MSRTVFCAFLQCQSEGLDFQVYPGSIGKRIHNEISKKAWQQWINKQTTLINENKLNLINQNDRKFLENEMIKFLFK